MKIFRNIDQIQNHLSDIKKSEKSIGLIPTMGALHEGHLSLIKKAKQENEIVVVSIFVNPTQFDNPEDLEKYPQTFENDCTLLESVECDLLFYPEVGEMYNDDEAAEVFDFEGLDKEMEGAFRDNHFNGVGTIVYKFFNIIKPDQAYFGEKDFQQLQIVKKLAKIKNVPVKIHGCAIYREHDGLAMSSRNIRLNKAQRLAAPIIFKTLSNIKEMVKTHSIKEIEKYVFDTINQSTELDVEYFSIADETTLKPVNKILENTTQRAFIAVFAGEIRLIDNLALY